jgi:acylphosphatase
MVLDHTGDRPAQRQFMHRQNPTTTVIAVTVRVRLDITGVVQGVGFRPAVARIAAEYGLGGWVYNDAGAVHCEFEGPAPDVDAAVSALQHRPPPMARIDTMAVTSVQTLGDPRFEIIENPGAAGYRHLCGLLARDARPCRPPVRSSVHHLHQLRAALHRHHRSAL